ncbi:unnamed protein product [Haemonchus placei]|uniref:DUF2116 family Zn-ribbon domain-containing protein n=1 Tax=Haemonchus placei TaxID=6290 RepID=A0A0N4WQG9_HAEPC|nr:unnamed protein product [Haemonchus placei]
MQVAWLGLCGRCRKPAHAEDDDCGVQCAACGRPHSVIMCATRETGLQRTMTTKWAAC